MKILLTTLEMEYYGGLPLYTRDMALELKRQGHIPEIYTLKMGKVAQELLDAGIPVTDNPARIKFRPDIIHGQHRVSTLIALKQFRTVPALFICHNHIFWGDEAPFHPRILLYLGISLVCMERLKKDGVPENKIIFSANFVDTNRFTPRTHLPGKPLKALVFSNYANEDTHLPVVREACHQAKLELDVVGLLTNYVSDPENILGKYDIVFAKAKAAIESMAIGSAVILCDFCGVGPMVTASEFEKLRMMNFGFQSLTKALKVENILPEISRYDPDEAIKVRDLIRTTANLQQAAKNMLANYETIIKQYRDSRWKLPTKTANRSFGESLYWERAWFWATLTPAQTKMLDQLKVIDPASQEHSYIYTRDVVVQEKQTYWFRDTFIPSVQKQISWFQDTFIPSIQKQISWFQDTFIPSVQKQIFRFQNAFIGSMKRHAKESGENIKNYVVAIWMAIPEPTRIRIKKLPLVKMLLGFLKYLLRIEPNQQ
jgi:hypothetical protein